MVSILNSVRDFLELSQKRGMLFMSLCLIVCISLILSFKSVHLQGDVDEYILMSAAVADHGTPEIRLSDLQQGERVVPELAPVFDKIRSGMALQIEEPKPGFFRANNGNYYAIHFSAYSALVAVPFKICVALGINVLKAFLFINLLSICVLAFSARVFFADWIKASACVALWMICGGLNYLLWLGPEIMCAALLTSGIMLFLRDRFLLAGLCVGFAALQNPPIILALGFLPLLRLVMMYEARHSLVLNVRAQINPSITGGLAAGAFLFLLPIAFNLWAFGTPNIIMKLATIPSLMGTTRLFSFFFDLNQGMLIGFFGVWLVLAIAVLKRMRDLRSWCLLFTVSLFAVALALPALTTGNWNSGAIGMMRYAFWAGMPFFVLLMLFWHSMVQPRVSEILLCLGLQAALTCLAFSNLEVEFNGPARFVLRHAPSFYNPEPELFIERNAGKDGEEVDPSKVYAYALDGKVLKRLAHQSNMLVDVQVCGPNQIMLRSDQTVPAGFGWYYINGEIQCRPVTNLDSRHFADKTVIDFPRGWSQLELGGGEWSGRWSDGPVSEILIPVPANSTPTQIVLSGHYFQKNVRTRVYIDGKDLGWQDLRNSPILSIGKPASQSLKIKLEHEFPIQAGPIAGYPKGRELALFLTSIKLF